MGLNHPETTSPASISTTSRTAPFELARTSLGPAEHGKHIADIVLNRSPFSWITLVDVFFHGLTVGSKGVFKLFRSTLARP